MRISYFDFLRGIAIIMVVFIHCIGGEYSYLNITLPIIVVRNLMNVAVPLFLAISGYFLASKQMENGGYISFLKRQIPRVYIPVLFCSLAYLMIDFRNGSFGVGPVIKFFSCSYSVYYFVAVIMQCYLLLWILQKKLSKKIIIILFVAGCAWWAVNTYVVGMRMEKSLPLILYAGNFIPWGFFFVLGMYFSKRLELNNKFSYKAIIGGVIFFMVLSVVESFFVMEERCSLNGLGQKVSAFCLNAFLCIWALHNTSISIISRYDSNWFYRLVCLIGRYSFGIYLIHLFIRGFVFKVVNFALPPWILWIISSMIIISICLCFLMICKKIFPKASHILLGV